MKKNKELIKAQSLLQIRDIRLKKQLVDTSESFGFLDELPQDTELHFMSTGINCGEFDGSNDEVPLKFQVFKHKFGLRVVEVNQGDKKIPFIAQIEAEYDAIYIQTNLDEKLTEKDLVAFSNNVEHNLWPFWREHVYSTLQKIGLSSVIIPLNSPKFKT